MAKVDLVKKSEELLAPARALNELVIANTERLVDMQLDNARKYSTLVLNSLKDAAAVKDPEGAKSYVMAQVEVARKTGETLVSDGEALAQLGREYATEVQNIVKSSLETLPKLAAA